MNYLAFRACANLCIDCRIEVPAITFSIALVPQGQRWLAWILGMLRSGRRGSLVGKSEAGGFGGRWRLRYLRGNLAHGYL